MTYIGATRRSWPRKNNRISGVNGRHLWPLKQVWYYYTNCDLLSPTIQQPLSPTIQHSLSPTMQHILYSTLHFSTGHTIAQYDLTHKFLFGSSRLYFFMVEFMFLLQVGVYTCTYVCTIVSLIWCIYCCMCIRCVLVPHTYMLVYSASIIQISIL